ncbi:hypothetical protein N7449_006299 [Penicillium cf. viridicatum]|uniref:Uncharacterized protein n=1 Tax=Penicillium cf. viridicatum TaxID=2972119 RepID=A0A9W9MB02_9EURO|nr:hypothetical protein N7449_006299 [Penicillium cf. viridicatum]
MAEQEKGLGAWIYGVDPITPFSPLSPQSQDFSFISPALTLEICGLSTAERTGSPVFHTLWSYVSDYV